MTRCRAATCLKRRFCRPEYWYFPSPFFWPYYLGLAWNGSSCYERERSFSQGVRSQTTFRSCPKIAILGGESISWAMTCVFLRLMVSPKPWQALLKRFMSFWRSSAEWAVTLAPLGKRRSRRHFIWTLSFLSDLVRRQMPSVAFPNVCSSRKAKKIPNKVGARTKPYFSLLRMSKGSDIEPAKTTVSFVSSGRPLMMLRSLGGRLCLPGQKPSWGLWRLRRVFAVVPCISPTAVGGRTQYQWLTCWIGNHVSR